MFSASTIGLPQARSWLVQHQRPPKVARVGHLDDEVGIRAGDYVTGDAFVFADGAVEGVHPWRVDYVADFGADQRPALGDGHGGARVVRHGHVATPSNRPKTTLLPTLG
jgi:hypothetical protein